MPATNALNDLRKSMSTLLVIIMLLLVILGGVVFVDRHNDSDRRAREKASQINARLESTRLYNADQTRRRVFQRENILTLSKLAGRDVDVIKASPEFAQYGAFVDASYPYRQTSKECIAALFDPAITDCAPASNEAGDP